MPFASYHSPEAAVANASRLMRAGAHVVKLEGGAWLADSVRQLVRQGIPVCAHLGLTPQSVNLFGGFVLRYDVGWRYTDGFAHRDRFFKQFFFGWDF